ncbi:MAG: GTPase HflX [Caldivirga sp.]
MGKVAVLAYVDPNPVRSKIDEFRMLAEVAGYSVKDVIVQRRVPDSRFYVGAGKLKEIKELINDEVGYLIAYHQLKPSQSFNLSRELGINVMDRVKLILEIFDSRAGDAEAKLQIRLAELRYTLPMIKEYIRLSKRGEQIGFHGLGEYGAETYYKHALRQIASIRRRLQAIKAMRDVHIVKRRDKGIPEVVLTGYTMAGKTTLFNKLTGEDKYIDGKAFATLSTYSRLVNFNGKYAVVTDTVGFIDDLPPVLIESFYSTIREIAYADLILLLIDSSDPLPEVRRKLSSSVTILNNIGVPMSKVIPVFNKIDQVNEYSSLANLASEFNLSTPLFISAKNNIGLDSLKSRVAQELKDYVTVRLNLEYLDKVNSVLGHRASLMMISDGSALINVRRIDVKVLDENGVKYSVEG